MRPIRRRVLATAWVGAPLTLSLLGAPFAANVAWAQTDSAEAVESALVGALTLLSGGLIAPREHPPSLTRDGNTYRISIPLPGLTTPPNAAVEAVAKPLAAGMWDIPSLTFPKAGTLPQTAVLPVAGADAVPPGTLSFSIGQQAIHGTIDPSLTRPSPFAADLRNVTLRTDDPDQHTAQTIEHYVMDGIVSGAPGDTNHRLNVQSQGSATNISVDAQSRIGVATHALISSAAGSFNVEGLDRDQAERLTTAGRAFTMGMRTASRQALSTPPPNAPGTPPSRIPPPGTPQSGTPQSGMPQSGMPLSGSPSGVQRPVLSPALRLQLRAMVDACAGLLSRLEVEETLQQIRFDAGGSNHGDIGHVRLGLTSEARNDRLSAQLSVTIEDVSLSAVPADFVAYVPRQIDIKPAVSNVHADQLLRLLRDATADDVDLSALWTGAIGLLADPDARVGIESLSFNSGPLQVTGSARLRAETDGKAGADIHLVATGVDALIAAAQSNPRLQNFIPMVFLAKGMARPQGDSLIWDISLGDNGIAVNGMPMGQPAPGRPPSDRPPSDRPPSDRPPTRR